MSKIKKVKTAKEKEMKVDVKKVARLIVVLLVSVLITGIGFGTNQLSINLIGKQTVEEYCSVAYQNSVNEYKECKKLNTIQLIDKLKEEANKAYDVPKIAELKF